MMSTREREREQMEMQDPQPGVSTFDRNHSSMMARHDPEDRIEEMRDTALMLRAFSLFGTSPKDGINALTINAAVLLEHGACAADWFRHDRGYVAGRFREERDDVRRDLCRMIAAERDRERRIPVTGLASGLAAMSWRATDPTAIAMERGWDCFRVEG